MTLRLLVADDNVAMHKMVRLAFTGEDAVIEAVTNGEAAIDTLREFRPDVVLADVSMPGYSGYEVCERIRGDLDFAAIPVILLNGAFDPLDEEEAARVKASGHLTKPFDPSEMIALVEKLALENARRPSPDFFDNKAEEIAAEPEIPAGISAPPAESAAPGGLFNVSPLALESYLGPNRILEILNGETFGSETAADCGIHDELINRIAEKVAKKISPALKP